MNKSDIMLAARCGGLKVLFERECEERIHAEYSARREVEILRSLLLDSAEAVAYAARVHEIRCEVKRELEEALGCAIDVGFDEAARTSMADQILELQSALSMILEGVTG